MIDTPEARYQRDPIFKMFVDVIEGMLHRSEMSPTEIREGAMLACIHFEMKKPWKPMGPSNIEVREGRQPRKRDE